MKTIRDLLLRWTGVAFLGVVAAAAANAEPLTWTLVDVTSLGSSITGSFVYNANTDVFSSIDITTSGGTVIPSETWTNKASFGSFNCCLALVDTSSSNETGANTLNLVWTPAFMTDAGGKIPISFTQQGTCNVPNCSGFFPYPGEPANNYDVTGYIYAPVTEVPEPSTYGLMAIGALALMGAGLRRRRDGRVMIGRGR
jgi:hypothetical protein